MVKLKWADRCSEIYRLNTPQTFFHHFSSPPFWHRPNAQKIRLAAANDEPTKIKYSFASAYDAIVEQITGHECRYYQLMLF